MALVNEADDLVAGCAAVRKRDDGHGKARTVFNSEAFDDDRWSSHWLLFCFFSWAQREVARCALMSDVRW